MSDKISLYNRLAACLQAVRTSVLVTKMPPYPDASHHIATNILGAITVKQGEELVVGLETAIKKVREQKRLIKEKEDKL